MFTRYLAAKPLLADDCQPEHLILVYCWAVAFGRASVVESSVLPGCRARRPKNVRPAAYAPAVAAAAGGCRRWSGRTM